MQREATRSLLDLTAAELAEWLRQAGEPTYRARQILRWVYRELVFDFAEMTDLPAALRARLAAELTPLPLTPECEASSDGGLTRKALLRLADGDAVEAVLMVYPGRPASSSDTPSRPRRTVCVSSQVGCGVGCPFCATGRSGLLRNLRAAEVVAQVLHFARRARELAAESTPGRAPDGERPDARITNVVLMGQGEPLANFSQVWQAVELLNSPDGLRLGARHITISTSGLAPRIRELAEKPLQVGLAVSLHAPDDALRDRLVPVNRKYPIAELLAACRDYFQRTGRRVSFEYVLIDGVNDSPAQAGRLADLLAGLGPTAGHVNLIPLNPVEGSAFRPSPGPRVLAFEAALRRRAIPCTVRGERGDPIDAACGQLRARRLAAG